MKAVYIYQQQIQALNWKWYKCVESIRVSSDSVITLIFLLYLSISR